MTDPLSSGTDRHQTTETKLTAAQYALLATLKFSGERAKYQCSGLRGATWASLQDRGLIAVRFDRDGVPHFRITEAGKALYQETP